MPTQDSDLTLPEWARLIRFHARRGTGRFHHLGGDALDSWKLEELQSVFTNLRADGRELSLNTLAAWTAGRTVPSSVDTRTLFKVFWPMRVGHGDELRAFRDAIAQGNATHPRRGKRRVVDRSTKSPPPPSGLRSSIPFLQLVAEISPTKATEIKERDDEIRRKGYLPPDGALTDSFVDADTQVGDGVSELQLTGAADVNAGRVDTEKSEAILTLLDRCLNGTSDNGSRAVGHDRILSDAFIDMVIDRQNSDVVLLNWANELANAGVFTEARLIECVLSHGKSPSEVRSVIAELKQFREANLHKPAVTSFLNYRLAIGYRSLGLLAQSAFASATVRAAESSNKRFQAIILNLRHLNVPQQLYGTADFDQRCREDGIRLTQAFTDAFHIDPVPRIGQLRELAQTSIVISSLVGMILNRAVIGARSEIEAIEALAEVEAYGRALQRLSREPTFSDGSGTTLFKHAYWELSRIAPFALTRGWVRLFERVSAIFINGFEPNNSVHAQAHNQFLTSQVNAAPEAHFVQMVMSITIGQEMMSGNGRAVQDRLLPHGLPATIADNVLLGRSWAALQHALKRAVSNHVPAHTLPRMESRLMLDCVRMLT